MRLKLILTTLLLIFSAQAQASRQDRAPINDPKINFQDVESAQAIVDKAEKIEEQNLYNAEAEEIVHTATKIQDSEEYKKQRNWISQNQHELLAKQTKPLPTVDYNITKKELEKDAVAKLLNSYRFKQDDMKKSQVIHYPLMIFVSSSIPQSSLKDLMIQAKKSGAILVFRGMVGSIKKTAAFLAKISKDNVSAIIDPRLFDIFKVEVVPTFVVLGEINQECQSDNCLVTPRHDRITGNITLEYALEQMADGKGDASKVAATYLKKLTGAQ